MWHCNFFPFDRFFFFIIIIYSLRSRTKRFLAPTLRPSEWLRDKWIALKIASAEAFIVCYAIRAYTAHPLIARISDKLWAAEK